MTLGFPDENDFYLGDGLEPNGNKQSHKPVLIQFSGALKTTPGHQLLMNPLPLSACPL